MVRNECCKNLTNPDPPTQGFSQVNGFAAPWWLNGVPALEGKKSNSRDKTKPLGIVTRSHWCGSVTYEARIEV